MSDVLHNRRALGSFRPANKKATDRQLSKLQCSLDAADLSLVVEHVSEGLNSDLALKAPNKHRA